MVGLAIALMVGATAQAGLYSPADNVLMDPTVGFQEDTTVGASCPDGIEVGAAAVDISPYDPLSYAEPYEDTNGNGVYDGPDPESGDPGEPYTDENNNGKFDALFMAGYGHEKADNEYYMAETVHDPVWARALAVSCGGTTLGMVSVDTVGLFRGVVLDVREEAPAAYDHVTVASTHTHDSIDTMGLWGPSIIVDGKHPGLMAEYKAGIQEALEGALDSQEPVDHVTFGMARTEPLIEQAGTVQTDLRDPFVIDDRILAARFVGQGGQTIATVINWSPHPETLAGTQSEISSDYAHWLREAVETEGATLGGETQDAIGGTAVFFSGAVGGMMTTLGADPLDENGDPLPDHSYEKAARIGEVAAWAALDALSDAEPVEITSLDVQAREVTLPGDNPFILALNTIGIFDHELAVGPVPVEPVGPTGVVAPTPFFRAEVNAISLGDEQGLPLQILTVPGELLPEVALGNPLSHAQEATPEACWDHNAKKELFNDDREVRPDPDNGGQTTKGFERQLASNPDMPKEPAFLQMSQAEHVMLFGLANDELGYIVPADDYVYPTVFPGVYSDGTDRCGDDDHYEETVSASSYMAPGVARALAGLIDPSYDPEPFPTAVAGPVDGEGQAQDLEDWDPTDSRGIWVDTSRSGGHEYEEDMQVRVDVPEDLSGCWGFVNGHGQDLGQSPGEETRGFYVDLDGDCQPGEGDGYLFADAWALSEGQPYWNPS